MFDESEQPYYLRAASCVVRMFAKSCAFKQPNACQDERVHERISDSCLFSEQAVISLFVYLIFVHQDHYFAQVQCTTPSLCVWHSCNSLALLSNNENSVTYGSGARGLSGRLRRNRCRACDRSSLCTSGQAASSCGWT